MGVPLALATECIDTKSLVQQFDSHYVRGFPLESHQEIPVFLGNHVNMLYYWLSILEAEKKYQTSLIPTWFLEPVTLKKLKAFAGQETRRYRGKTYYIKILV